MGFDLNIYLLDIDIQDSGNFHLNIQYSVNSDKVKYDLGTGDRDSRRGQHAPGDEGTKTEAVTGSVM